VKASSAFINSVLEEENFMSMKWKVSEWVLRSCLYSEIYC